MKNRVFIGFIIVVIFSAIFYFIYQSNSDERVLKQLSLQKAKFKFKERDALLKSFINNFDYTIVGIKENKIFMEFVQHGNGIEYVNELFLSVIKSSLPIVQFRYINSLGDEVIRVDKSKNNSFVVPKSKLQNKRNRYYFKDIYNTKKNIIWHSKIDLNIEYGKIVIPIQPTLRIGTPVVIDGIKRGILIINIDVSSFLNKLQKASIFNIYFIDSEGNFLVHIDKNYSWSKYLDKKVNVTNYFKNFTKNFLLKNEITTEDFFAKKTTFKNDDNIMMLIEPIKSKILEDIKQKSKNRIFLILSIILIAISIGYMIFKRRHINLIERHSDELARQKQNIQDILDTQKSIIVLTDGFSIHNCNKRMLDFFGYDTLEDFTKEHDCICDFFEEDEQHNYLQKMMDNLQWTQYILKHKDEINKVKITNINKQIHIFQVNAKVYNTDSAALESVITFSDITQLENLNDNLEQIVNKKTKDLKALNETLEDTIKIEVQKNRDKDKQLFDAEKMVQMGEMIGNIAHQWRQPLSAISTTASGMFVEKECNLLDDKEFADACHSIIRNTEFLSETINTFTDFIKEKKEVKEVVLQDRIHNALKIVSASINNKFINLICKIDVNNPIKITMIVGELSQVIINIVNNAKDVLLTNGIKDAWIKLELYKKDEKVVITVEDNGGGIPDDILPKIFDPYFTTKHKSQGTGLGLHMSYKIITDSLGGSLYVKNTKNGAKFFIELPLS